MKLIQAACLRQSLYTNLIPALNMKVKEIILAKAFIKKILAGYICRLIDSICCNEFNVFKRRMMASEGKRDASFAHDFNQILKKDILLYKGIFDYFGWVIAKEGIFTIYKGFMTVWTRFVPTTTL